MQANYGYNKDKECFEIITLEKYRKYDQVYIPYNSHSNRTLLTEYGFCVADNEDDCIDFDFGKNNVYFEKIHAAGLNI